MKLSEAISSFTENLSNIGRSPATVTAYKKDLEQLQDFLNDPEVTTVKGKDIKNFLASMSDKSYSAKSVSRKLNSIKSLFKFSLEQKFVTSDPSHEVPHPTISSKLPRVLQDMEYRSLRDTAKTNKRIYAIIELMLQAGLRIGEVSRLKLENIQLKSNPPQALITEFASTPMRLVELNPSAQKVIEEFIPHRLTVEKDQGYLFNTKNGGNMNIRNIRSAVNKVFKKAGIKKATVNDLRNTFIVHQLNKGVSLEKVSQVVGHRRYSSTEKYLPMLSRSKPGKGGRIVDL